MLTKPRACRWPLSCLSLMVSVLVFHASSMVAECAESTSHREIAFPTPTEGELGRKIALFSDLEHVQSEADRNRVFRYRLFVPKQLRADTKYPLLIWLHGYGESGDDNWRHLVYISDEVARWEEQQKGYPCFVLAPQSPYERHWGDEVLAVVFRLIRRTIAEWPIDEDCIYAAGVSSGGNACWELGLTHSDTFAALSPMASRGADQLASLTEIPIWAFHVADDSSLSPDGVRTTIATLQKLGGPSLLTEIPGNSHDCWTAAFNEYHVTDWLLRQRRGAAAVPPPGSEYWTSFHSWSLTWWDRLWPPIAILGSIVAIVFVAKNHLRRRRVRENSGLAESLVSTDSGGFTLVEVLVVISIIGVLIALLMPAVQMARESARRSSCANNLKQIGLAVKLHTDAHSGIFPTGGWGEDWMGDPDKGFGTKQPGGWIYNVLPYLEQQNLRDLGKDMKGSDKSASLVELMQKPVEIFNCPSRRLPRIYPYSGLSALQNLSDVSLPEKVAKSDYAINALLSYEKSEVIIAEIQLSTGMSNTLLAGEKSLNHENYTNGADSGDGLCMYMGDSDDIRREASGTPVSDAVGGIGFGGPHPGGCNVVYCDGSVHFILEDDSLERGDK